MPTRFPCLGFPVLPACLAALPAAAQPEPVPLPPPDPAGSYAIVIENDILSGSDRYYTNGLMLAWRSRTYDPPNWLAELAARSAALRPVGGVSRWGLSIGQKMYTPEDTEARNPDPRDRPYAGWLYGAVTVASYTETQLGSVELQIGVIGPSSLAEYTQSNWHDIINVPRAQGWDYQLKDELGVNLIAERQWRYNQPLGWAGLSAGVVPSVAISLGNVQTYAAAGGMVRIGNQLEADFGPPRVRPSSAGSVFFQPDGAWGWYAFAGLEGRAVGHDITLDGNTWRDSRSVEREVLVGDASIGFAVLMPGARLTASYTIRTQEFTTQREAASFGSLSLAVRF
jgi:hypothetical protein